ncbi:hypothetical protein T4B_15320 [Trichinella pseudospiralis]|uniref:Uncharacterized protein n=1 Tax=Trichinella pseudospiralis TaxID=6337 RepID=A0A0V1GB36_TRIPS|nr:hypothetical protein T4B_15320 [Trichinella pseudospiralis]KRY95408.1 hypothetical protein T4C_9736 [Trichinella pseudospiralis]
MNMELQSCCSCIAMTKLPYTNNKKMASHYDS